jgi:hypothetical protein
MSADSSDRPDTSESGKPTCSRRAFLAGAATAAAGAMASTPAAASHPPQPHTDDWPEEVVVNPSEGNSQFDQAGEISREGYRRLAEAEYRAKKNGHVPTFSKRVHAVKDLGLDPNGGTPAGDKIDNAAESGMLIVCPKGSEFRLTSNLIVDVDGPFGIVGEGYKKSKHPPGPDDKDAVIFNADSDGPLIVEFRTPSGLFANFAVDQRGAKQMVSLRFNTEGYQLVRDLRTIGPHSNAYGKGTQYAGPALAPETPDGATVRVVRYTNVGGGKSGTKNKGGMPIIWVGTGHHGTLQLIDCHIENSPDNGLYGGRTPGNAEIYRGLWRNNDVSQARMSGKGSRIDGAEIELDEKNYTGKGSKSGFPSSNGIKWDSKPTRENDPAGGTIVNCDVRGLSEAGDDYGVGSLITVFPTAGAATIKNTRIVNKIDATPISADAPNGNSYPPPPQPHRIIVKNSLITGPSAGDGGAITISERPNSLVSNTCLKYPSASEGDISGAKTSNIGYGRSCGPKQGLSSKKKVGGSGSGLPPVNVSYNGSVSGAGGKIGRDGPSKGVLVAVVDGIFMLLLMMVGMIVLFVAGILGAFGAFAGLIGSD